MSEATAEWAARLRTAFTKAITEDDLAAIAKALVEKAKRGDEGAIRLLMTYITPAAPPAQKVTVQLGRRREEKVRRRVEAIEHKNGR